MLLKNLMKKFVFKLPKPVINRFYMIYDRLKYPEMVEKKRSFGTKNANTIYYVIRPRTDCIEGLMALFQNVLKHIDYAEKKGYLPFVDFENYRTQYYDDCLDEKNVWNYYFRQPIDISIEEVYRSKCVVLSGLSALRKSEEYLDQKMDQDSIKKAHSFVKKHVQFSDNTKHFVLKHLSYIPTEKCLGLYLRGTDYVKLKPAGHPVQPSVDQAIIVAEDVMNRNGMEYVFLVTEDQEIYDRVKEKFKEKLLIVNYDNFVTMYAGESFLSQNAESMAQLSPSPYQRGLNYLAKLVILSKCKCFVGGNTCGSWAASIMSDGYKESYVFNLGLY